MLPEKSQKNTMNNLTYAVICRECGMVKKIRENPHICEPCPRTKASIAAEEHEHDAQIRFTFQ